VLRQPQKSSESGQTKSASRWDISKAITAIAEVPGPDPESFEQALKHTRDSGTGTKPAPRTFWNGQPRML
jgi:hypothetical protein